MFVSPGQGLALATSVTVGMVGPVVAVPIFIGNSALSSGDSSWISQAGLELDEPFPLPFPPPLPLTVLPKLDGWLLDSDSLLDSDWLLASDWLSDTDSSLAEPDGPLPETEG